MMTLSYEQRREQLETYFDETAVEAWARLTSDAPLGRIRATVREGRERMRRTLLSWLPEDLHGRRILDAGCGTGMLAVEAARRGADVVAVDISPRLIKLARERLLEVGPGSIDFRVGDMLDPSMGRFHHVVAMDSLIHYESGDVVRTLAGMAERASESIVFTYAPRTPLLATMHAVGRLFPRSDRAPGIQPVDEQTLHRLIGTDTRLGAWRTGRSERVTRGFYISQGLELESR